MSRLVVFLLISVLCTSLYANNITQSKNDSLKVAVIGGMTMSGMWKKVSEMFTKEYGINVEVVETGPKHILDTYSRINDVDLITMHSSDTIVELVADGYFTNLLPWARNAQMMVSHISNPAKVDKRDILAVALKKIQDSKSSFVLHASGGTFEVFSALRHRYGFKPKIFFTPKKREFFDEVVEQQAYTLFGVIPFLMKKQYDKNVVGHFIDDETLHRPFLSAIVDADNTEKKRYEKAKLLQQFLLSKRVQKLLKEFRIDGYENIPVFFPIKQKE